MRDPKRIQKVLAQLEKIWTAYPDMRLGQLLINSMPDGKDLFYMEDEELNASLEKWFWEQT